MKKLNSSGDTLWTRHYGGAKNEVGFAVATDGDGNIFLAGETDGFGVNNFDAYALSLDAFGNIPCPPTVSFESSDNNLCEDETVFFTNTTVSSQPFAWMVDGISFSDDINTGYYFNQSGSYDISLSACAAASNQDIEVHAKPATHFTYAVAGITVNFFLDAGIDVQDISWNFGDGSSLNVTDHNPTHIYPNPGQYWVILSVTNNEGCDSTYIEQIALPVGIEDLADQLFSIYPNPNDGKATLRIPSGTSFPLDVSIMNLYGQVVLETQFTGEEISFGDLAPGVYLLRLTDVPGKSATVRLEVL